MPKLADKRKNGNTVWGYGMLDISNEKPPSSERNPRVVTSRGQGAPRAQGPHASAPQPRGSLNAGTRGTGGPRGGAWRGRAPHRGWSTRGSRGRGGRGRGSEPQDPCTQ